MFVLGTAGHVDHGKSTFLRALTSMDPDRLPEEKKRGMTIDLNFVWLPTEKFSRVGIVDVPGHRDFVKNMISGVASIDAFLFILAADDGWMPQSEEHLRLLEGLGIHHGIGIITKIDLAPKDRIDEIETLFQDKLSKAFGRATPITHFSKDRPETLTGCKAQIEKLLEALPPSRNIDLPRIWVDRVFTPVGKGVVVTGTLRDGDIKVGDTLDVLPAGKKAVVRALQAYHATVTEASAVSRVAIQLSRVETNDICRGQLLQKSRCFPLSQTIDAYFQSFVPLALRKPTEFSFHIGTHHAKGLMLLLKADENNRSFFVRIKFKNQIPMLLGERFVIRTSGEEKTVGTGEVVDLGMLVRSHKKAVTTLAYWASGVEGQVRYFITKQRFVSLSELAESSVYSIDEFRKVVLGASEGLEPNDSCERAMSYQQVSEGVFVASKLWDDIKSAVTQTLETIQKKDNTSVKEAVVLSRVKEFFDVKSDEIAKDVLGALVSAQIIRKTADAFVTPTFQKLLSPEEELRRANILARFREGNPLSLKELESFVPKAKTSLSQMVKDGAICEFPEDYFLENAAYNALKNRALEYIKQKGQATTSELRGFLNRSRKNTVLILEQMDRERLTYLKDGVRRLLKHM